MPASEKLALAIANEPTLKVDRAKKHILDLNAAIASFIEAGGCKAVVREDPEQNRRTIGIKTDEAGLRDIGLILGEAVHNLRSSLDVLAVAMVSQFNATPEGVHFPFPKKKEGLNGAITGGKIHLAGPEVVKIIEDIKPYPGGDDDFLALHQFDVTDKHRIIIPMASVVALNGAKIKMLFPEAPSGVGNITATNAHNVVSWGPYLPASRPAYAIEILERQVDIDASFTIVFRRGGPLRGEQVVLALRRITGKVSDAINRLSDAASRHKCL